MAEAKEPFSILLVDLNGFDPSLFKEKFSKDVSFPTQFDVSKDISDALGKIDASHYHLILADRHPPDDTQDIEDILKQLHPR